jgi:hypothetical protein
MGPSLNIKMCQLLTMAVAEVHLLALGPTKQKRSCVINDCLHLASLHLLPCCVISACPFVFRVVARMIRSRNDAENGA